MCAILRVCGQKDVNLFNPIRSLVLAQKCKATHCGEGVTVGWMRDDWFVKATWCYAICKRLPCYLSEFAITFRYSFSKFGVKMPLPMLSRISCCDQKRPSASSSLSGLMGLL